MRTQSGGWAGAAPTGPSSSIVSDRQPHRGHANQAVEKAKKKPKKKNRSSSVLLYQPVATFVLTDSFVFL